MGKNEFEIIDNVLVKYHQIKGKTEVVIPDGVVEIKDGAFMWCNKLVTIKIPNTVKKIGSNAFFACSSLTEIMIPDSVVEIGNDAFENCFDLKYVKLSNNITEIEERTFFCCENLDNIIIPGNVEKIGVLAFDGCTNLSNVTISEGVKTIKMLAFSRCESLNNIVFPESLTEICSIAFTACKNLKSITLSNNIKFIGEGAFDYYYIENININSYKQFDLLDNELKPTALISTIKNYYTGKIKYSDSDMIYFIEYIKNNIVDIFSILDNEMIYILLFEMKIKLDYKDFDKLIKYIENIEVRAMLLEYAQNIPKPLDEWDLGEFGDDEKGVIKKN